MRSRDHVWDIMAVVAIGFKVDFGSVPFASFQKPMMGEQFAALHMLLHGSYVVDDSLHIGLVVGNY